MTWLVFTDLVFSVHVMSLQITEQVKDLQTSNADKEDTLRLRKTTLDLLPDAANNISRLEVSC